MDAVARLFTFVKDESYLLGTWIPYHGSLFGLDNLHGCLRFPTTL